MGAMPVAWTWDQKVNTMINPFLMYIVILHEI